MVLNRLPVISSYWTALAGARGLRHMGQTVASAWILDLHDGQSRRLPVMQSANKIPKGPNNRPRKKLRPQRPLPEPIMAAATAQRNQIKKPMSDLYAISIG